MRRVRWVLFFAAAVCLLGGVVMYDVEQDASTGAFRMLDDAVEDMRHSPAGASPLFETLIGMFIFGTQLMDSGCRPALFLTVHIHIVH